MRWGCGWAWIGWLLFFRDGVVTFRQLSLVFWISFLTLSPQSLWIPNKTKHSTQQMWASELWLPTWFFSPCPSCLLGCFRACFHFSPGELVVLRDYENSSTVSLKNSSGGSSVPIKANQPALSFPFFIHLLLVCAVCTLCLRAGSSHLPAAIGYRVEQSSLSNSISNKMKEQGNHERGSWP